MAIRHLASHAVAWAARGLLWGALAVGPLLASEPPRPGEVGETSLVDVVEAWPFVIKARKPANAAHCRALGPKALRVTEDGKEMRVLSVARGAPLTTHALLIDTSSSMTDPNKVISRKRGRQAKAAARAYVGWMLESAADRSPDLALFTFDDELIMHVPPTPIDTPSSADAVMDTIHSITGGYRTGLNDAVWRTVDYLSTREGRSVVILLSDGMDTASRRTSRHLEELTRRTNNVTVFTIGIGLRNASFEQFVAFLERVARSTGGRYFGVWGKPADLAERLEGRFEEIQRRLASQLYVSWLTDGNLHDAERVGSRRTVEVRIASRDRRCHVPTDGYRALRALDGSTGSEPSGATTTDPEASPPAARDFDSTAFGLRLTDRVADGNPLVGYAGHSDRPVLVKRNVRVDYPRFEARPRAPSREPESTIHRWIVDGRFSPDVALGSADSARSVLAPLAGEINGKSFLDQRDALAAALAIASPDHHLWATNRAAERIRARFERLLSAPQESGARARYEERLDSVVRDRVASLGAAAYRDDLAAWLGDVSARELADRLERFEANLLLAEGESVLGEVDRVQTHWSRIHDWLRIPDRVRVTVPLVVTCGQNDGPCGYYRIILPRLADLPEDLSRPTGKTIEPTDFESFRQFERIKVPRHPFGIMTLRWLLGLTATDGGAPRPAAALDATWSVKALRHWPDRPFVAAEGEPGLCLRRVRFDLERDGQVVWLEILVEGRPDPGLPPVSSLPDPCEGSPEPVRLVPKCFDLGPQPAGGEGRLAIHGIPDCGR